MEARDLHAGQRVGIEPVPLELRPVEPLSPEQRDAGWKTQAEVEREMEERIGRDIAGGLIRREEIAQAEQDIETGSEWVRRL